MQIKNVIFDFNGVLLWDSHLHELVWKEYALKLRGTPLTDQELHAHFHGYTNKACFEYLLGRSVLGKELADLINERERFYRELCLQMKDEFVLSPGAIQFLDKLVEKNIPHTIATSSEKSNVDFFFQHLNLKKWFDRKIVAYDDGSMPSKPAPDIYLKAVRLLHANPNDCLVIEDAQSGIQAAHAAGVGTIIAITSKNHSKTEKKIPGVTSTINSLHDMLTFLDN